MTRENLNPERRKVWLQVFGSTIGGLLLDTSRMKRRDLLETHAHLSADIADLAVEGLDLVENQPGTFDQCPGANKPECPWFSLRESDQCPRCALLCPVRDSRIGRGLEGRED